MNAFWAIKLFPVSYLNLEKDIKMAERETGQVKWFNEKKGFGFIVNQDGDDVFVHFKDIQGVGFKTLHENEKVSFISSAGDKGLKAQDVLVVDAVGA